MMNSGEAERALLSHLWLCAEGDLDLLWLPLLLLLLKLLLLLLL